MSTTDARARALAELAAATGRTRADLLDRVEQAWGLSFGESARLRTMIAKTPEPASAADMARAERAAEAARQEHDRQERERDAHDLETFRRYQAASPFDRASMRTANDSAIERGRLIASQIEDEPPPDAA